MRGWIRNLLVFAFFLQNASPSIADGMPSIGDFGLAHSIIPAQQNGIEVRFAAPKVVVTPAGPIIVAVLARNASDPTRGGVPSVAVSTDGGAKFGPLRSLRSDAADAEYVAATEFALGLAPDGSVILLSQATDKKSSAPVNGWRSSDQGVSWQPVNLSAWHRNQVETVFGGILQVPNKGLLAFGFAPRRPHENSHSIWEARSTDGGLNWSPARAVPFASQLQHAQPTLINTGEQFVGLVRTDPNTFVQIAPRDQGGKWDISAPGILSKDPAPQADPHPCLAVDPMNSRHLLALLPERIHADGANLVRGRIALYHCDLNQLRWHHRGDIARCSPEFEKDITAKSAWLTPLGGRRWLAIFYCDTASVAGDLYGLTFELTP